MTPPFFANAVRAATILGLTGWAFVADASTVTAISQVSLPHSWEVYRASDDAQLYPDTSVSVQGGGINLAVIRSTPGVSSSSASDIAQITNLLSDAIYVGFDEYFLTGPGVAASASATWQVLLDGTAFDIGSAAIAASGCSAGFPCEDEDIDPGAWYSRIFLAPGATAVFQISGTVYAELAPIPLPATAGLLLLGVGALAAGRQLGKRSTG